MHDISLCHFVFYWTIPKKVEKIEEQKKNTVREGPQAFLFTSWRSKSTYFTNDRYQI